MFLIKFTQHKVCNRRKQDNRYQSHRYYITDYLGEKVCRYSVEPTDILMPTTKTY